MSDGGRLQQLLDDVEASSEFKTQLPLQPALPYLQEVLEGLSVVDYFVGYKPAAFVGEAEDELGVAVLTRDFVLEFVFGPHRRRYDITPLRLLAWLKLEEKEAARLDGGLEPLVKFEARFAEIEVAMLIEVSGGKAEKLKAFAKLFHQYLMAGRYNVRAQV